MQTRTVDLDGPAHYVDFGGRGPAMVLVHGLGGSHVDWSGVGPDLAKRGFRVFAPDLIGFGYTPLDGRSAGVASNQAFLDRFIALVCDAPPVVVGNSMGGLISILEAAAAPNHISALVLVDPAVPPVAGEALDPVTETLFTAYDSSGAENLLRQMAEMLGLEETFDQFMAYICADPSKLSEEMRQLQLVIARERLEQPWADRAFLEAARSLLQLVWHEPAGFFEALDRVAAPTLLIEGDRDRLVLVNAARAIAERRPDWTLEVLPGIGHVPMMEDPEGFVDLAVAWLAEQGLTGARQVEESTAS